MALIPQMTEQRQEWLLRLLRREMKTGGGRSRRRKLTSRGLRKQNNKFFVLTPDGEDI